MTMKKIFLMSALVGGLGITACAEIGSEELSGVSQELGIVEELVLATAENGVTSGTFTQWDEKIVRLSTGSANDCTLSPLGTETFYTYVKVSNPNSESAAIELTVRPAESLGAGGAGGGGASSTDLTGYIAAYSAIPTTELQRKACLSGSNFSSYGCEAEVTTCLNAGRIVTVPGHGAVYAYLGQFGAGDDRATFELEAKILALGNPSASNTIFLSGGSAPFEEEIQLEGSQIKRLTGGSALNCTVSSWTETHYTYVELNNTTSSAITLSEVRVTPPASAPTATVTGYLAAYANAVPAHASSPDRKLCLTGAVWDGTYPSSCTGSTTAGAEDICLRGARAVTVPAHGSVFLYVGQYSASDPQATFNLAVVP